MSPVSSRICVLSGRYPQSKFDSHINHKAYCDRHGYTYIYCNWPTGASNPYLNKIMYISAYIDHFDLVFWIDDDAFFIDLDKPLDPILPNGDSFLSICSSPDFKAMKTVVSSGQFAIRANETGKCFLREILDVDLERVASWWRSDLGYFTRGDQDAIVYLTETDDRFSAVEVHHYSIFNSRIDNLRAQEPVFILHLTGSEAEKKRAHKEAVQISGRTPSLLPASIEAEMRVRRDRFPELRRLIRRIVLGLRLQWLQSWIRGLGRH